MNDLTRAMNSILLRNMPANYARELHSSGVAGKLSAGSVLFNEGDEATAVYIVLEGSLKLARTNAQGNEAVVAIQRPGDAVATALAFGRHTYPVTCTAVATSRFLELKNANIRSILLRSEDSIGAVLAATYSHLHELVDQVAQLKASSAKRRLVRFLLTLSQTQSGPAKITLPYEKVVIAGVLGMTPETLSRSFNKVKELGISVDGNEVRIEECQALMAFLNAA